MHLQLKPRANQDLAEVAKWYEQEKPGLGVTFMSRVDEAVIRIQRNPEFFGIVHRDVRLAKVHRFPYAIYFRVGKRKILVLGVLHTSRDPRVWQSRI